MDNIKDEIASYRAGCRALKKLLAQLDLSAEERQQYETELLRAEALLKKARGKLRDAQEWERLHGSLSRRRRRVQEPSHAAPATPDRTLDADYLYVMLGAKCRKKPCETCSKSALCKKRRVRQPALSLLLNTLEVPPGKVITLLDSGISITEALLRLAMERLICKGLITSNDILCAYKRYCARVEEN